MKILKNQGKKTANSPDVKNLRISNNADGSFDSDQLNHVVIISDLKKD